MSKLVKIGDAFYKVEGFALTALDAAPDPVPEDVFDATELAGTLDGLTAKALTEKAQELVADYKALRNDATSGGTEALTKAREAMLPALVAGHLDAQRTEALSLLSNPDDAPQASPGLKPNEPAPGAGGSDPEPAEDDDDAGAGGGDGGGDNDDEDVDLSTVGQSLSAQELQTVAAAGAILVKANGGSPADQLSALLPSRNPVGSKPATPAGRPAQFAGFTAAANLNDVNAGAPMDLRQMADELSRWGRSLNTSVRKSLGAPVVKNLGRFNMYGDTPALVASGVQDGDTAVKLAGEQLADFHGKRHTFRQVQAGAVTAAAPERCGPNDFRRDIPDAGDISSPLLNALQSYPAPHCTLEHYTDISLSTVQNGITVWDADARAAFQDALDAWRADVAGGGPYDPQLYADLKAAEKQCAIAGCPSTAVVTMLPIAACLEYPTDLEYCSPETIRAYNRALAREFVRQRTAAMLTTVTALSATVTVDASGALFTASTPIFDGTDITNTVDVQMGASIALDFVISTLKPQGVMLERITAGNYALVLPFGLGELVAMDGRFAGVEDLASAFPGVSQVITALDVSSTDTIPYPAVPAAGSTTAFEGNLEPPTDWSLYLLDLDDFFEISRPDIELGAQLAPSTIRGNMVFGGFMESAAGYGKDGVHPAWKIDFSNLVYNGVRPARVIPVGAF